MWARHFKVTYGSDVKFRVALLNQQVTIQTKKVNHGDLRADRPSHERDVRAFMDEFTVCRRDFL